MDLDPEELLFSDQEKAEMQQQQAQAMHEQMAMQAQAQSQLQAQQVEQQLEIERQQAAINDEAADNELERELVRRDVEAQHAAALENKKAQTTVAVKGIEGRQKERLANLSIAQKAAAQKKEGGKK